MESMVMRLPQLPAGAGAQVPEAGRAMALAGCKEFQTSAASLAVAHFAFDAYDPPHPLVNAQTIPS
jgi:hypothetical protein